MVIPFCQERKTSFTVRMKPGDETQVNIFVKGAPESITALSNQVMTKNFELIDCDDEERLNIRNSVLAQMEHLKVISYAYKMMDKEAFDNLCLGDTESLEFLEELQEGLIYLGSFGLEDTERDDINQTV